MKFRNSLLTAILSAGCLAMSLGLAGCGPKAVSDQTLATDIQAKLFADSAAKTANVKVAVNGGIVTLTGDAPSSDVALQVVNITNGTAGVKSVDNQLKVNGAAASAMPPVSAAAPLSSAASQPPPQQSVPPPPPVQDMKPAAPEPREHKEARADYPPAVPAAPHRPAAITIPAGTDIPVRMIDSISSKTAEPGQTYHASLDGPLVVDGETVIPSGAPVSILLAEAKGAGRIKGNSELEVRAVSIEQHGKTYNIETNVHEEVGKGRGKQTAVRTGIGAAAGAVIGAIAGGGKGAAIGSLAGGGAGAGYQLATHGQQVTIASETQLTFRLQAPLVLNPRGPE